MDRFEKIAEIRIFDKKDEYRIVETLENTGFTVCLTEDYGSDGGELIVMRKDTPNKNEIL